MLAQSQFNTFTRRINWSAFYGAGNFNVRIISKLLEQHGSVIAHEKLPVVSELWFELLMHLQPEQAARKRSLKYLGHNMSRQMWTYINNSAMLPNYGQGSEENVSTILNAHMINCNKSAIIISRPMAIQIYKTLQQMGKPCFFGEDVVTEKSWGYKLRGHFSPNVFFRPRHLFDSGLIEWWQKFLIIRLL